MDIFSLRLIFGFKGFTVGGVVGEANALKLTCRFDDSTGRDTLLPGFGLAADVLVFESKVEIEKV